MKVPDRSKGTLERRRQIPDLLNPDSQDTQPRVSLGDFQPSLFFCKVSDTSPQISIWCNIVQWHVGCAWTLKHACVLPGYQPHGRYSSILPKKPSNHDLCNVTLAKWDTLSGLDRLVVPIIRSDDWDVLRSNLPSQRPQLSRGPGKVSTTKEKM